MRFWTTLKKNFKLLFRNKESAYTIVFGPLLIILIVSFAFMGSTDEYTIRVGIFDPGATDLAAKSVETMNINNYLVSTYPRQESCVEAVELGNNHACIVFSEKETGNSTIPVTFYLDTSRVNIRDRIINDLSEEMGYQSDVISEELASATLTRIQTAEKLLDENMENIPRILELLAELEDQLSQVQTAVGTIPLEYEQNITNVRQLKGYHLGLAQNTREVAETSEALLDDALILINDLEQECENCSVAMEERIDILKQDVRDAIDEIKYIAEDVTEDQIFEANLLIEYAMEDLEEAEEVATKAGKAGRTISSTITKSDEDVTEGKRDLQSVENRLDYILNLLAGESTEAETIATPLSTNIISITVADDQLSFTYPYLLILVIMFIGILLASTLIVTDKISRAAFRNFTTPTSDGYHVRVAFITAFLLLVAEVAVILVISSFFIAQPLLLNFGSTMLIICVAIILFTFLGMIIGYLSKTQEASMIASISVGSVLLFVSNLVLPMEGMKNIVQIVSVINPYIVLSELLKRSMLYGVTAQQIYKDLTILFGLCIVLLFVTVMVQRYFRRKYFKQEEPLLPVKTHVPKPLMLGETHVHDAVELMDVLDRMTRKEFESINKNVIGEWVSTELRIKRLGKQLRTKSKERMILKLDKYLEHHAKNIKR